MIDQILFQKINFLAGQNSILDAVMVFSASKLGPILVAILFLIWIAKWRDVKRRLFFFVPIFSAILARLVFTELIRWFYYRPRPFIQDGVTTLIQHSASGSFPSGHAALYFALASGVYFYNKKLSILFFSGAILISFARVFAGLHWPSDILGGWAAGLVAAFLVRFFVNKIQKSHF